MKRYFLLMVFLAACSKENPSETATGVKAGSRTQIGLAAFGDSLAHDEKSLLAQGASALQAGLGIPSEAAESCWRRETSRPVLRDLCLLLWASRGSYSAPLEEALRTPATRMQAVAAVARRSPLQFFSFGNLLQLMRLLREDQVHIRTQALEAWVERHGRPALAQVEELLPFFSSSAQSLSQSAASMRGLFQLRPALWQKELSSYCDIGALGYSRARCWRLLGALAGPGIPAAMAQQMRGFLPPKGDMDWQRFMRHEPVAALQIQKNLSLEAL